MASPLTTSRRASGSSSPWTCPIARRWPTLLDRLDGRPAFYKVGLELFIAEGERAIELVRKRGGRVFLDLKLHDIPETVARAVASAARIEAELLTVHTSGGYEMLSRAAEAGRGRVKILGVTVLTSLVEDDLRAEGIEPDDPRDGAGAGAHRGARRHRGAGLLAARDRGRARRGARAADVVPGIRPRRARGAAHGDQKRVATAGQAIARRRRLPGRRAARCATRAEPAEAFEALVARESKPRGVSEQDVVFGVRPGRGAGARAPARGDRRLRRRRLRARPRSSAWCRPPRSAASPSSSGRASWWPSWRATRSTRAWSRIAGAVPLRRRWTTILATAAAQAGRAAAAGAAGRHHRPAQPGRAWCAAPRCWARTASSSRRAARRPVTPAAVKASAGATERVRIAEVGNLLKAIDAPARAAACACWAPAPAAASGWTTSTSRARRRWSSAPKGRGCARRWRGGATACSTSRSAASCRR